MELLDRVANYYADELLFNPVVMNYLIVDRGIKEETLHKYKIGYAPNHSVLVELFKDSPEDMKALIEHGLIQNKYDKVYDYYRGYIIYPIVEGGGVVSFSGRKINSESETMPKHFHLKGASKKLFNSDVISQSSSKKPSVIIVESVLNALSLLQIGYRAVATMGNSPHKFPSIEKFKGTIPYIAYDCDANGAGQKAAIRTAIKLLDSCNESSYILTMPVGVDINDYFAKLGKTKRDFSVEILSNKRLFGKRAPEYIEHVRELKEEEQRKKRKADTSNRNRSKIEAAKSFPIEVLLSRISSNKIENFGSIKKCRCPLPTHDEDTPSFVIYEGTNTVKCFGAGCNFYGDSIQLYMAIMGVPFMEAVEAINKLN